MNSVGAPLGAIPPTSIPEAPRSLWLPVEPLDASLQVALSSPGRARLQFAAQSTRYHVRMRAG